MSKKGKREWKITSDRCKLFPFGALFPLLVHGLKDERKKRDIVLKEGAQEQKTRNMTILVGKKIRQEKSALIMVSTVQPPHHDQGNEKTQV